MKYTVMGFNQVKAVELNLDCDDLLILSYFSDFRDTELMVSEDVDGKRYYWLKYDALLENLPILRMSSKSALRRRLKKLQDAKVLNHYCKKTKEGTYSFYGVGENFLILKATMQNCTVPTVQKSTVQKGDIKPVNNSNVQNCTVPTAHECTTRTAQTHDRVMHECTTRNAQMHDQKINLLKDSSIKNTTLLEDKKEQSSTSSDSLLGIKKVIYLALKEVSPQDFAYGTWFEPCEVIETDDKVIIKAPNSIYGIMPRKYMKLIEETLDKPVELIEMEG